MTNYEDLKKVRILSKRNDTNSCVDLLQEENTENFFVRKTIYGIENPLYQAIFTREIRALYKLNSCPNVVKIYSHKNMKVKTTQEKVGCIFLEYIWGETLERTDLTKLSSKDKFKIISQLLSAIEVAHSLGIIHRDINPNNIMITDENDVKVIDFGICKIKEMVNKSTVYQMATNRYSAPEVHLHSENATEQSDLYSIGAVIFYLFTGCVPPKASEFQKTIENISGIDIELKPIISKLVHEDPNERYKDIYSLKIDLSNLLTRFLDSSKQINVSMDYEKFSYLKNKNLISKSAVISDTKAISENFSELYAFKTNEGNYDFLGINFKMICTYNSETSILSVIEFRKVMPIERENMKKRYAEIKAYVNFVNPRFAHRESRNNNIEICNIVNDYYNDYISKKNVNLEYRNKYGVWREFLNITKQNIEDKVLRFSYDSYTVNNKVFSFVLSEGVYINDEILNKEVSFVYEKKTSKKQKLILVGYYEGDYFENDRVVLKIKFYSGKPNIPQKGSLCLDYRKELSNVQRQLDAIDTVEKENYSCPFGLKEIISGVEAPQTKVLADRYDLFNKSLDISQSAAVRKSLNSESFCIIQGPPGTGKTNVVIEIIKQILRDNKRNSGLPEKKILLVSQSHPAVDKMLDDLIESSEEHQSLIRIGRDEKLNEQIKEEYGINYVKDKWVKKVCENCESQMKLLLKQIGVKKEEFKEYYSELEKKQIIGLNENDINDKIIDDFVEKTSNREKDKIRQILEIQQQWMEQLQHNEEIELYIIKSATIIAGTCIGFISNKIIRNADFDYLIIDEAAKATFPELAVSFNKAAKIIMVGDHKQLPPVLDNDLIQQNKDVLKIEALSEGVFEKLYDSFPDENKHRLTVQYRMHPAIGTLISHVFYEDEIQNGTKTEDRKTGLHSYENIALEWLSTSNRKGGERYETRVGNASNYTYKNNLEINIIKEKLKQIDSQLDKKIKIGLITAYSAQKYAIENMVKQNQYNNLQIEVDTVDAFQGSQKEIIIYSTVRSSEHPYKIGFLKSEARLNVAFSRAKCLLIIVGDHKFLNNKRIRNNKFPDVIHYIENCDSARIVEM